MFLIALLFNSLGTMIASVLDDMHGFQMIINFLVMPLFFLSGALFPLEGLPVTISIIAALDPLSYGIDALRILLINSGHYGLVTDVVVLGMINAAFLWFGSLLFKRIQV